VRTWLPGKVGVAVGVPVGDAVGGAGGNGVGVRTCEPAGVAVGTDVGVRGTGVGVQLETWKKASPVIVPSAGWR
jgi:hypothetical protein